MAGGVQTCQLTQIPLCGRDIMAIVVRQSVFYRDVWVPMTIPSYGCGNDDFMALDPLESSTVQDVFAQAHALAGMEELLSEVFVMGNRIPKNVKEERLRGIPVGLVYIDKKMWKKLHKKIIKSLHPAMDWMPEKNAPERWATEFIEAVQKAEETNDMMNRALDSAENDDILDGLIDDNIRRLRRRSVLDGNWKYFGCDDWGKVSQYTNVADFLDSWSEHQNMFSLQAYFPIMVKYSQAVEENRENIIKFFEGVKTLMLLNKAIQVLRQDWKPKSMIQEYKIHPLHDKVAKLVRKEYKADKKND